MTESIIARMGLDSSGISTGIASARSKLNDFVATAAKIGAGVAVGMFVKIANDAINLGSKISDLAEQLRIGTEELQVLFAISTKAGVSQQDLERSIRNVTMRTQEAIDGNAKYGEAFKRLNINVDEFNKLTPDKRLEAIGRAYAEAGKSQEAYTAVAAILGEKAGPKMLEVLRRLADEGFPALTKEAKEAGLVMSESTIAALDKAADEIAKFKDRITVAIGNIIVNFRTEEGLKALGAGLMEQAARFGGMILDAIVDAGKMIGAVIGGSFTGVANLFRDAMLDRVIEIGNLINKFLPERFEINVGNLEQFKSSGQGIADSIHRAIADTEPSNFRETFSEYWRGIKESSQAAADALNDSEFTKTVHAIPERAAKAGEAIKTEVEKGAVAVAAGGKDAGDSIKEGGKAAAASIKEAAASLKGAIGGIGGIAGGAAFNNASDAALKARIEANNRAIAAIPMLGNLGQDITRSRLQLENQNAKRELDFRRDFKNTVARGGEAAAYREFSNIDPLVMEKLFDQFTRSLTQEEKTNTTLESIDAKIKRLLGG
jgi:hypothetical protein